MKRKITFVMVLIILTFLAVQPAAAGVLGRDALKHLLVDHLRDPPGEGGGRVWSLGHARTAPRRPHIHQHPPALIGGEPAGLDDDEIGLEPVVVGLLALGLEAPDPVLEHGLLPAEIEFGLTDVSLRIAQRLAQGVEVVASDGDFDAHVLL